MLSDNMKQMKKYQTPCVKVLSHQRQHEKEVLSSKHTNL